MRACLPILLLAASLARTSAADEAPSVVRFANNDSLPGSLHSLTTEQLVWNSPVLEKPTPFLLDKVLELSLTASQPEVDARHEATVTLTNGDVVRGQLAALPEGAVELDTWYAGRLRFNRPMVSGISIAERPKLLYRGPTGLDDWTPSAKKSPWIYQNGALRANGGGSLARSMDLPDEFSIAFDVEWRNFLNFKLIFFSDDLSTELPGNGYEMTFQRRYVYLRNCETKMSIGSSLNAVVLQENEKVRMEIRSSLRTGKTCIIINGETLEVWTDPEFASIKRGGGIHFIAQRDSPVRISRIEVAEWDGHVDKTPDPAAPGFHQMNDSGPEDAEKKAEEAARKEGRMELRNGDSITGVVTGIEDGRMLVQTPFRDVRLPLEALRGVNLKAVDPERCKRENGDVRAWMPDGSSLVFRLEEVGDGTLSGYSQNFGKATFKSAAFNRIEFNIYEPDLEDARGTSKW
ncbi:MAG: hypothetical protein EOP85_04590 [Verrucomicrobiaceae bacterium]|nr:MAG: hypothetical protein EOP85_04590 [Verrucomicrobiaceae bacterium]